MKKRILTYALTFLSLLTSFVVFTSCNPKEQENKLSVVTTIFPEYDWVKNILGDCSEDVELTLLLDSKVDLHNYQPSVADIANISNCDLFIYVGGESDEWVENALSVSKNESRKTLNLFEVLKDALKEGHDHDDEHGEEQEEHDEEHEHVYDEHVWLSLKNAKIICAAIAEKLSEIDVENAEAYQTNAENYLTELTLLDEKYTSTVSEAPHKAFVFADRFPFRYLAEDYGIAYFAAFDGCSAETEASFETIVSLAKKVDELGISALLTIEGCDNLLARTIIENTAAKNQKILSVNSMQATTIADAQNGVTYLSVMEKNLKVLEEALQ